MNSVIAQKPDHILIRVEPSYFEKINALGSRVLKVVLTAIYWVCNFFTCGRHHRVHSQKKAIFVPRKEYRIMHPKKTGEPKSFSSEEGRFKARTPGAPVAGREDECFTSKTPSTPKSDDGQGFDVSRLQASVDRPRFKRVKEGKYNPLSNQSMTFLRSAIAEVAKNGLLRAAWYVLPTSMRKEKQILWKEIGCEKNWGYREGIIRLFTAIFSDQEIKSYLPQVYSKKTLRNLALNKMAVTLDIMKKESGVKVLWKRFCQTLGINYLSFQAEYGKSCQKKGKEGDNYKNFFKWIIEKATKTKLDDKS